MMDEVLEILESFPPEAAYNWMVRCLGEAYHKSFMDIFPCYRLYL